MIARFGWVGFVVVLGLVLCSQVIFSQALLAAETSSDTVAASAAVVTSNTSALAPNTSSLVSKNPSSAADSSSIVTGGNIVQVVLSLVFIIVLIYVGAWYIRRMQLLNAVPGQSLHVVAALSVGARERVVLVQVGEQQMLLGVAPGRVNCLQNYSEPIITAKEARSGAFANMLSDRLSVDANQATSAGSDQGKL